MVAGPAAGTAGLAMGIATGDLGNAVKYATIGAGAGYSIGRNVGDGVSNLAGGAVDFASNVRNTYKEEKADIIKDDKEAQKAELHKANKKYANSLETKAAIKKKYGKLDKEQMAETQNAIVRYRDAGVEDLDVIFNSYNLEQGKDSFGNKINEDGKGLDQNHAMYLAQMASKMDPDNEISRKSVENKMQNQFAENYENDGMNKEQARENAKALRKQEMQYIDMIHGKTKAEAESIAKQSEIKKDYEDSNAEKQARMQAKLNVEAQTTANAQHANTTQQTTTNAQQASTPKQTTTNAQQASTTKQPTKVKVQKKQNNS